MTEHEVRAIEEHRVVCTCGVAFELESTWRSLMAASAHAMYSSNEEALDLLEQAEGDDQTTTYQEAEPIVNNVIDIMANATDILTVDGFRSTGYITSKGNKHWHIIWEERPFDPTFTPGYRVMPEGAWNHMSKKALEKQTEPGHQWSNIDSGDGEITREFVFTYLGLYQLLSETTDHATGSSSGQFLNTLVPVLAAEDDDDTYAAIGWTDGIPSVALHVVDDNDGRAIKFMSPVEALRLAAELVEQAQTVLEVRN